MPLDNTARRYQPRHADEQHFLFLTLVRDPYSDERVVLRCQGEIVSRNRYCLLRNMDTGQLHIYWEGATWGDCCTAQVTFEPIKKLNMLYRRRI